MDFGDGYMPIKYQTYYRASSRPAAQVPLGVMSAGYYRMTHPYIARQYVINFAQLFWCVSGSGAIVINQVERMLKPSQMAIYLPGMEHQWHTSGGSWNFYWMALDGPLVIPLFSALALEADIYDAGHCPVHLFRQLLRGDINPSKQKELRLSLLALQIMFQAVLLKHQPYDSLITAAVEQINQKWQQHDFNVKTLAASLHIDRSILSRRFYKTFGIAPSAYITSLRLQNALNLLQTSKKPLTKIMSQCGYNDLCYFSRIIRRATKHSPSQFRKIHT